VDDMSELSKKQRRSRLRKPGQASSQGGRETSGSGDCLDG
jgi:hypothetical protein